MASADVLLPPKQEFVGERLINRALSYSLVNNLASRAQNIYGKAKESNSYIKSALEKGEDLAVKTLNVTQPILSTVDKKLHIEDRSIGFIDSIEKHSINTAQKLNSIQNTVVSTVTSTVARLSEPIVDRVERYLPHVEEIEGAPSIGDDEVAVSGNGHSASRSTKPSEATVKLTRVTKRLTRAAATQYNQMKKQTHDKIMKYQVAADILQFASTHADVKSALAMRDAVTGRVHAATDFVKDTAAKTAHLAVDRFEASPLNAIFNDKLKPHLDVLKDQSSRALLIALAAIGTTVDFIYSELRTAWKGDWNTTVEAATTRARDIVSTYSAQSPQLLFLVERISQLGATIQTELTRYASGTWSYVSTMRAIVQAQSMIRDALLKVGINPAQLSAVLMPSHPQKKLQ